MTDITPEELEELERVAKAATPGPWYQCGAPWFDTGSGVLAASPDPHVGVLIVDTESWAGEREEQAEDHPNVALADPDDDARFIATFDPPTVLRLIAAARRPATVNGEVVLEARLREIGGCSDGNCIVIKPIGMHTNGGCKCWRDGLKMQRVVRVYKAALAEASPAPVRGELTADFVRALPGGALDDSTFEAIESALDAADAPCQGPNGKWLTLPERIAALSASPGGQCDE